MSSIFFAKILELLILPNGETRGKSLSCFRSTQSLPLRPIIFSCKLINHALTQNVAVLVLTKVNPVVVINLDYLELQC